jgi:hypothetical protein
MPTNKTTLWKKNARPDVIDFRDKLFEPTLKEVPPVLPLEKFMTAEVPVLDQGEEGACTGFALATVAHYLLRTRLVEPDATQVSPQMFFSIAKKYDEFSGEDYDYSSARGAIKGWHKHGVCSRRLWAADYNGAYNLKIAADAVKRPLGAYYRVNHKDLVSMHSAINEAGILYVCADADDGWDNVGSDGYIKTNGQNAGGHAFVLVAYDQKGFWLQNSWGKDWGMNGYAHLHYDDWLQYGYDCWVVRLGAPVILSRNQTSTSSRYSVTASAQDGNTFLDFRPHLISIGNNGQLKTTGTYGNSENDVADILRNQFPEITKKWKKKRLVLYAHGGLVPEETALQRLADYRRVLLDHEIYPLFFMWHTGLWDTIKNMLKDFLKKRAAGSTGKIGDFFLDRLDDGVEVLTRKPGTAVWEEIKENALSATANKNGAAQLTCTYLDELLKNDPAVEVHALAHSAGSIFEAPLLQLLSTRGTIKTGTLKGKRGMGHPLKSCTLWAPACTIDLFKSDYLPLIKNEQIEQFTLYTLTDQAEQDDSCGGIYNKSLLYLVSNAFERIHPVKRYGKPILGMEEFVMRDQSLREIFDPEKNWVTSPNQLISRPFEYCTAMEHGAFDDNEEGVRSTFRRILNDRHAELDFRFHRSNASIDERKSFLDSRLQS